MTNLIAHTTIEIQATQESLNATWIFHPGTRPCALDAGSGPELIRVEVDGMPRSDRGDCAHVLQKAIGMPAFERAERRALEVARRDEPEPFDREGE